MARTILWASLALAPATILVDQLVHPGDVSLFVLAAIALVPLAWLIGESTDQAANHTGARMGGLLNASFGNAPELIISLFAVSDVLPNVVRGSLAGSIVSNILLVLGVTMIAGPRKARIDRRSLLPQIGLVGLAVLLFLIPSVPGFHGNPERHALVVASIPVSAILLVIYLVVVVRGLRGHGRVDEPGAGWSLSAALGVLGVATLATAFISEILVHSLHAFADAAGLSEFFIAAVIVAIVGNAAEHGGAILIARRENMALATEIAVSSSAQVGLLVVPIVVLCSLAFTHPVPLSFRWEELAAMGGAAAVVAATLADGRTRRSEGWILVTVYVLVVIGFYLAGDR